MNRLLPLGLAVLALAGCANDPAPREQMRLTTQAVEQARAVGADAQIEEMQLAEKKLQLTLSVSLHAPNNDIRSGMMPVNDAYPVEVLMQAVRRYQETTGRRVSFEYSMVRGVNDSDACAKQLADLIRGMGAHVNLIPINPVDGSPYSATDAANVRRFQQKLESLGVNATVRRRLGSEISAACGQLRRDEMNGKV